MIIDFYKSLEDWLNLIKDFVFICGGFSIINFLWSKRFEDKSKEISNNLELREKIEPLINEYVYTNYKNNVSSGVRFVFWKNYPYNFHDDAFANKLFVSSYEEATLPHGYIDNTGFYFEYSTVFSGFSAYLDKNGIFFFAPKSQKFKNFREIPKTILKIHLPYKNLINFDFKQRVEYEPLFYTRYHYTNFKKLFSSHAVLKNQPNQPYLRIDLNLNNMIQKYSLLKYIMFRIRHKLLQFFA